MNWLNLFVDYHNKELCIKRTEPYFVSSKNKLISINYFVDFSKMMTIEYVKQP